MAKVKPLPIKRLRATLDPAKVPYADSRAIPPNGKRLPPQPRALQALELGLHIRDTGYNIFVAGEANLGRTYLVNDFLRPRAAKRPTPPDLAYVYNFDDPDRPKLLTLSAGVGKRLRAELAKTLTCIRREIPARLETEVYLRKRTALMDRLRTAKDQLLGKMESVAGGKGFNLDLDESGALTLYPLVEGKVVSEEEFERLDTALRKTLKSRGDKLMSVMTGYLRKVNREEQKFREHERNLDQEVIGEVLDEQIAPLAERFMDGPGAKALKAHFAALRQDILANPEQFIPKEPPAQGQPQPQEQQQHPSPDDFMDRYEIHLFVDNGETRGAPVVVEDHPTQVNLLGCIEREAEMGALITDFTLIKAGALHRANGGFLILHVDDLLQNLGAWDGLLRALRSGRARIEDAGDGQDQARTKTIEPDPVLLDLKVLLVGPDEAYEALLADDRFRKLFKIKAHLQESVPRNAGTIKAYLLQLGHIIREAGLLPFHRDALAELVDYASQLTEDQKKLSLKLPLARELMVEASATASMEGASEVDAAVLRRAAAARDYRSNLYEEEFMEEYDREMIKVATSGSAVGRVNGLSVTWFGDYEFGLPHQIACTVGVGHGGIIDLEREAELGGPIHTKAMMILKSHLLGLFAQDKPLVLAGSLCFEQSYAHVEGDSASGAELAALLSALAQAPINLSLAFTGAVNQSGAVLAVGGVTRKIEGFFQVCSKRGLTGGQGVIIPRDNADQLMLRRQVRRAVEQGLFHVYPVGSIEEAMELLTGMQAGRRRADGTFPRGTLYRLVDTRLAELTALQARHTGKECPPDRAW